MIYSKPWLHFEAKDNNKIEFRVTANDKETLLFSIEFSKKEVFLWIIHLIRVLFRSIVKSIWKNKK